MTKKIISRIFAATALFLGSLPLLASAHVKWFAESTGNARPYELTDLPVLLAIAIVIVAVAFGIYLEKKLDLPRWFKIFKETWAPHALSIASIGFGLSFLIFSYNGFIFAPNLIASGVTGNTLLLIQAIAGVMIFFGFYERIGGFLLVILFALGFKEFGLAGMMDAFEMLGFALYAMIVGRPKWKIVDTNFFHLILHKMHSYGVPLLRTAVGLNLIILGFSEKILAPAMTQNFLAQYNWNFMQTIGFEYFTNYWFAFAAGASEILLGIFLLLGIVTRTTTLALAIFLTTSMILLGPVEIIGHLPHFSIAIVLLVLGAGSRLRLIHHGQHKDVVIS